METRNHIKRIFIPGIVEEIVPATPFADRGAINVFCGQNNSGKSHILKALAAIADGKQASAVYQGFSFDLHDHKRQVRAYLSGPHWNRKEVIGVISSRYRRIDQNKPADFRNFSLRLFYEQLESQAFLANDEHDSDELIKTLDNIPDDEFQLTSCNKHHEIIDFIEGVLNANLLYRKAKGNIEFVLANPSGLIVPYPEWSDGQKTVFYFILCMQYWRPDVLFADEIENHLHPMFMSKLLEFIKQRVPQTFVATHHPHIIFSDYIDQAFYLETQNARAHAIISRYTKVQQQKTPKRKLFLLSNSFSKLEATYKLFDVHDRQLLKQASQLNYEVDFSLYRGIIALFYPDVLPSSTKILPDRQTLDISTLIDARENGTRILDFGSGIGRVINEFKKLSSSQSNSPTWLCWEPQIRLRQELSESMQNSGLMYKILDTLDELVEDPCDVAVIANVVHELTPKEFADLLISVNQYTKCDSQLLISEIHPLLQAEKYAVPYPYSILNEFLNEIGFTCTYRSFPIKDAQAYCIKAKKHQELPSRNEIIEVIEGYWKKIKVMCLSSYHTRMAVKDSLDFRGLLMELNTVASIDAWENGFWQHHV